MNQVAISKTEVMMSDLENTKKMCQMLMQTPHYQKLGTEGIFAIIEKAKSVGVNPIDALNGGMYYTNGKVEMASSMMNQLIRSRGHSVTKDKRSNDTICILHGRRADNGDTWVESFSLDEAIRGGLLIRKKNRQTGKEMDGPWQLYPRDMLFARALSRLARQLFADVIKGCYVEGEISQSPPINSSETIEVSMEVEESQEAESIVPHGITQEEAEGLDFLIGEDDAYRECVMGFIMKRFQATELWQMPRDIYEKILPVATKKHEERQAIDFDSHEKIAMGG